MSLVYLCVVRDFKACSHVTTPTHTLKFGSIKFNIVSMAIN